jgi:hypothetical protein
MVRSFGAFEQAIGQVVEIAMIRLYRDQVEDVESEQLDAGQRLVVVFRRGRTRRTSGWRGWSRAVHRLRPSGQPKESRRLHLSSTLKPAG